MDALIMNYRINKNLDFLIITFLFSFQLLIGQSESVLHRTFSILNLEEFPQYHFYIQYQTYPYSNALQKGETQVIDVLSQNTYRGGDFPTPVYLEALDSDSNHYRSNILVSGKYLSANAEIESVVDQYQIASIENGIIQLKYQKELLFFKHGNTTENLENLNGIILSPDLFVKTTVLLFPILFGLIIVFFLYLRINMQRRYGRAYFEEESFLQKE